MALHCLMKIRARTRDTDDSDDDDMEIAPALRTKRRCA
jgi:hypothetical protein